MARLIPATPQALASHPSAIREIETLELLARELPDDYRILHGVPAQRIGEILAGRRAITADTDLRLCRFFGLSDGWWLRLQVDYDTAIARVSLAKQLAHIKPWPRADMR